jgi:hypothetical protein
MRKLFRTLKGQTVALDTMVFIYAFEDHPVYLPFLRTFFQEVEQGTIEATTSPKTSESMKVLLPIQLEHPPLAGDA